MPAPNILSFDLSDNQQEIVRKINYNFEQITSSNGGGQGPLGTTGATGLIGRIGPVGYTGNDGPRGSRWFVGGTEAPTGGYGDIVVYGDYWIDSLSLDKSLYSFGPSGWFNTGYNLLPEDEFSFLENIISSTGATSSYKAIIQKSELPSQNTFVLSDGNPSVSLTNPDYTNFLITTDPKVNQYPILELSRTDATITGASGYFRHPIWRWTGTDQDYDISFVVPSDRLSIITSAGITANSTNNAVFQADDSLSIQTKGKVDILTGGPSFFNSRNSLGITASNLNLSSQGLTATLNLSVQSNPDKSPVTDPIFGNYSLWIDNPSGTSLFLGATGSPTGGNQILTAQKNSVGLFDVRTDGVIYSKKNSSYIKVPTFGSNDTISTTYAGGLIISWYFITVDSLGFNNTFILDVNPANNIGVAINVRSGDGQNVMNNIEKYQSMKINVLTKSNDPLKKIKYLGYYTGSPPIVGQYLTFPDGLNQVELEIFRGDSIGVSSSKCLYFSNLGSGRLF